MLNHPAEGHRTAMARSEKCLWDVTALELALASADVEARSITVDNLMFEHGPALGVSVPLLATAITDEAPRVRSSAESALSHLGRNMSAKDADAFEESLTPGSAAELATRILLLAYYLLGKRASAEAARARSEHIVWIIRNAPHTNVAGSPDALVLEREDRSFYAELKELWLEQTRRHATNAKVQGNAASFFTLNDKNLSEELYKDAKRLEPENPDWPRQLGHLYSLHARRNNADSVANARRAFNELRDAEEVERLLAAKASGQESPVSRDEARVGDLFARTRSLRELAKAAFEAGEFAEARRFASELLDLTMSEDLPEFFGEDGNAIHYGNLVLGRCCLRDGDIEQAKEHLLASGRTKGSPNLGSFGPNTSLALELLEHGERDVVLQYFELCRVFWDSGSDRIDVWVDKVKRGQIPLFGANLNY